MTKTIISAALAALFSPFALAITPFVVKDIRVEGTLRVEAGTVFNYLPIRIGETVDDQRISQALKSLYATGFFKDVRIESDKDVLVVIVDERPAISKITISGNKEFSNDVLLKGLKDAGISESKNFDRSVLDKVEQEIKELYLTKSYYSLSVRTTASPLERNRVAINIEIEEGEIAKIKQIHIIGASAYSESTLLKLMSLSTTGWWSWLSKDDRYSKQKLQGDLEEIRSHYLNHGYADFNIDSSQVSITPDKRDVYMTIAITEGQVYKISSVKLAGDFLVPETELSPLVDIKSGEVFSREHINVVSKRLSDRLGNDGYAFATVNPIPELDKTNRTAALTFFVDPGRRAYVNRVNIVGNNRTSSEIIRREIRQMESSWYDRERIDRSKIRVERTGFFEEVAIDTEAVPGSSDQVDLNVKVKERSTGNLSVGVGYSQTEKVVLSGSIAQNNLFGTGNSLTLQASTGRVNQNFNLNYTNPYYTKDGVSRGFDLYHRKVDTGELDVGRYATRSTGVGVRFGVPISEDDTINYGLSADITDVNTFDNSPLKYKDFVKENGNSATTLLTNVGWARDHRDSFVYPTKGAYQRVYAELALPPAELRYARIGYSIQNFTPLTTNTTLMLATDLGWASGYGDKELPFYKNYYAGGIGTVRGYKDSTLGPKSTDPQSNGEALGGTRQITGSAEFLFPVPGMKEKDRSMRLSTFLDGGQVWGDGEKIRWSDLRFSYGFAFSWTSPVGPLKFSLGFPVNKKDGDDTQKFQFQIGQIF
ncbi:outer membrane protein assembly factor BamA [Uliginosibacterium sp. H3]|uniref:Outer membrane protein assembly factor BamA n=1 Tax=Uliginosibacterium silvisoli TaxID=3114758 RepID=A0ABU6K4X1_9RHOO|nr:outer membrane protein assembly factor BamA [Uliginosibacterium sp. H3]